MSGFVARGPDNLVRYVPAPCSLEAVVLHEAASMGGEDPQGLAGMASWRRGTSGRLFDLSIEAPAMLYNIGAVCA